MAALRKGPLERLDHLTAACPTPPPPLTLTKACETGDGLHAEEISHLFQGDGHVVHNELRRSWPPELSHTETPVSEQFFFPQSSTSDTGSSGTLPLYCKHGFIVLLACFYVGAGRHSSPTLWIFSWNLLNKISVFQTQWSVQKNTNPWRHSQVYQGCFTPSVSACSSAN